jgi:hypothetical protein
VIRAQSYGDRLIKETLAGIERRANAAEQAKRRDNGRVVERYIRLKQDQLRRSAAHESQNQTFRTAREGDVTAHFGG